MGRRRVNPDDCIGLIQHETTGDRVPDEEEEMSYDVRRQATNIMPERYMTANCPEMREKQMVALTYDAVEERIRRNKASAQEYVYFLKLGSANAELERRKLEVENKLAEAKIAALKSAETEERLLTKAIEVFGSYKSSVDAVDDTTDEGCELYDFEN